jgi:ribose/xylose/arabinose/galactoside ABC-type transport system permease subunit
MTELTRPQPLASKSPRLSGRFKGFSLGEAGIYYALAMVWAVLTFFTVVLDVQNFLDPANLANILYQASFVAIIAVPMTLVLISGNFDLSVASTAAISAACVLLLSDELGIYPAMAISLAAGALIGFVNAAVVQGLGINAFIVTLATMTALRGVLLIITGGHTASANDREALAPLKWLENGFWTPPNLLWCGGVAAWIAAVLLWWWRRGATSFIWGGVGLVLVVGGFFFDATWPLAKPVYYMAAVTAIGWCVTRFTIVGRRLQAVGANPEAARLIGISINRYRIVPFVLNGLAASFVGLLFAARLGAVLPNAMSGMELTVITAAILGGTSLFGGSGSVLKSVTGAVVLYSLVNGFDILGLGTSYQGVIEGVVLIIAAAIYTIGNRGRRN